MSDASTPFSASLITVLIFSTALVTPFPPKRDLSPSRSSSASNSPVDAPLGATPLPTVPSRRYTSASTVGLPLESIISLPITFSIAKKFSMSRSFPMELLLPLLLRDETEGVCHDLFTR